MLELPCPRLTLSAEIVKVGTATAKERVVVAVSLPDVPVMVSVEVPMLAELLATRVSTLFPTVGVGEKDAVTPLGRPETARFTPPANPKRGLTETEVEPEAPWPILKAFDESVKDGAPMVRAKVVVSVRAPDMPVMVIVYCPTAAEALAVSVTVLSWYPVMEFGEKDAVTPLGKPDAERLTLPVNPFKGSTPTEVPLVAPWPRLTLPGL